MELVSQAHVDQLRGQDEKACEQQQSPFPAEEISGGSCCLFLSFRNCHWLGNLLPDVLCPCRVRFLYFWLTPYAQLERIRQNLCSCPLHGGNLTSETTTAATAGGPLEIAALRTGRGPLQTCGGSTPAAPSIFPHERPCIPGQSSSPAECACTLSGYATRPGSEGRGARGADTPAWSITAS